MGKELTRRQQEILNFLENFISENGYSPSYREIAAEFDMSSTFGVKRHLDALTKKGFLTQGDNINRSISLTHRNKNENTINQDSFEIPIIGRVAAGLPVFAPENIEDTFVIDKNFISHSNKYFGLRVKGESMKNAGIFDGDLVIVKSQSNALNKEIVVALIGDETTLKTFSKNGNHISLVPENEDFPVIEVSNREDFQILGKVVGVYRKYN